MKSPGRKSKADQLDPAASTGADGPAPRIHLGDHSAGSAAATIRQVGELLGYVVVASGPASFRLTKPVRRGIRRVDQAVNVSLTNGRDGLWVDHDGPIDPRLVEQLQAQARFAQEEEPAKPPPPVANLPRADRDHVPTVPVRPGAAPQGLIDSVPGAFNAGFPPPRLPDQPELLVYLPDGTSLSGDEGVVIGRDPDIATQPRCRTRVAIDDPGVSKTHVAVWVDQGAITVEDLHSTNGSAWSADGESHPCEAGQPIAVPSNRVQLLIGSATIVLERRI